MNKAVKARWVAALRSGDYVQTTNALCRNDGAAKSFCCLGVLTDLYVQEVGGSWVWSKDSTTRLMGFEGGLANLPESVRKWADLPDFYGAEVEIKGLMEPLSVHNDEFGVTFLEIADAVEAQL